MDKLNNQLMELVEFIIKYGVIGTLIGTVLGFGLNNFVSALKTEIIQPYVMDKFSFKGPMGNIVSSFVELVIILIFTFVMYKIIIKPLVDKYNKNKEKKEQKKKNKEEEWKKELLLEIKKLNA